ncbi:MAG: type II toxin-antitoxin system RelE/ParE family toxin [Vulcanimicrobiaceae bacterium]
MKGNLRDVIEIVVDDYLHDRTYRTMCTTKIGDVVYALHAFQKKSTSGASTPSRARRGAARTCTSQDEARGCPSQCGMQLRGDAHVETAVYASDHAHS